MLFIVKNSKLYKLNASKKHDFADCKNISNKLQTNLTHHWYSNWNMAVSRMTFKMMVDVIMLMAQATTELMRG